MIKGEPGKVAGAGSEAKVAKKDPTLELGFVPGISPLSFSPTVGSDQF